MPSSDYHVCRESKQLQRQQLKVRIGMWHNAQMYTFASLVSLSSDIIKQSSPSNSAPVGLGISTSGQASPISPPHPLPALIPVNFSLRPLHLSPLLTPT